MSLKPELRSDAVPADLADSQQRPRAARLPCGAKLFLTLTLFVAGIAAYGAALNGYLIDLQQPWVLRSSFWASLCFAMYHEHISGYKRLSIARIAATAATFALGVVLAHFLRDEYVASIRSLADIRDLSDMLGSDIVAALRNRVVGYGGAYALGQMASRLLVRKALTRLYVRLTVDADHQPPTCPHCNQYYRPEPRPDST